MKIKVNVNFRDMGKDFQVKKIYDTEKEEISPELAAKAIRDGLASDADEVQTKAETAAPKNKGK